MNHDYAHCADFKDDCPKKCFRAKLVRDLQKYGKLAPYGITVNCVAPGPTQTGWIDDDFEKEVVSLIPMKKLIQPEDIADTILFLASEKAKMITGQVIKVSGGHAI